MESFFTKGWRKTDPDQILLLELMFCCCNIDLATLNDMIHWKHNLTMSMYKKWDMESLIDNVIYWWIFFSLVSVPSGILKLYIYAHPGPCLWCSMEILRHSGFYVVYDINPNVMTEWVASRKSVTLIWKNYTQQPLSVSWPMEEANSTIVTSQLNPTPIKL